jgi:hypothetical protein
VFHDHSLTRSRPGVRAAMQVMAGNDARNYPFSAASCAMSDFGDLEIQF